MVRTRIIAWAACALFLAGATSASADPVQDNLRRLKDRLKAARAKSGPKPATGSPRPPVIRRRSPRTVRVPRVTPSHRTLPPGPRLDYKADFLPHRLGTLRNSGDILVETKNNGKTVYVYWNMEMISNSDGRGEKHDLAPGRYRIMLKGTTLVKPWIYYATVKSGHTTLVRVTL
ncbi:MAG: hypothetical protein K0Q72_936 [Armatimonadetes bacterium]|jgi:hypothetical protein|nr:hypothetical protein [Armatimonadota bacterium]